ncbi:Darcynin, protein of unknown function [Ensifer adhaerens]|nr:Darcynin, protein of unknown function [Ensifer adhaerens]HZG28574.1 darcynin family protein [Ensifer sp.]
MSASRFTIFMLLEALPSWLSLDRTARGKIAEEALGSSLSGFNVTHRHYDAEAFSGRCSDISVFETDDLPAYYYVIERLRDSAFFAVPYFRVIDIIPTIAEGYRDFEDHEAGHAA